MEQSELGGRRKCPPADPFEPWNPGWKLRPPCGDAAEAAGALPDLHRRSAFGKSPRGGECGAIGDAVDAVAGDDVVGRVERIEAILGHRALLRSFALVTQKRLAVGGLHRFACRNLVRGRCASWSCRINGLPADGLGADRLAAKPLKSLTARLG